MDINENEKTIQRPKVILTKKVKDNIFVFLLVLLPIIHFLVFWLYLNYSSIALAFQDEYTGEFTLGNFQRFFTDFKKDWNFNIGIKTAIENTFITAFISMFVSVPLVVFVSYVLFKKYFGHMFFRIVFYIPGLVGAVVITTMTQYILDAIGPIVTLGSKLGIDWSFEVLQSGLLQNEFSARPTFFITSMFGIAGETVLLLTGALQKIPQDLFDSGKIDGVGMGREFIYLVVPCCWSTIGIMWIMTFAHVWGSYERVMLLTGGNYGTNNFAYWSFSKSLEATRGTENFNYPAAIGLLMTLIIAPLALLLRWIANKVIEPVEF